MFMGMLRCATKLNPVHRSLIVTTISAATNVAARRARTFASKIRFDREDVARPDPQRAMPYRGRRDDLSPMAVLCISRPAAIQPAGSRGIRIEPARFWRTDRRPAVMTYSQAAPQACTSA